MALPAILPQITITSSNKYVDVYTSSEKRCSVTEQSYDSIITLAAALQSAIRTTTADSTFTVTVSSTGTVTIARTGSTFELRWSTGTDAATNMGAILGFNTSADDTGQLTYSSDYQHMYGWYPETAPESDSYDRPLLVGPPTVVGNSGRAQRITWATQTWREVKFAFIPADKFLDAYSLVNQSFEEVWEEIAGGTPFEYYSDISTPTNDGTYCLVCESNEDLLQGSPRLGPGDAYYERTLKMVKQP